MSELANNRARLLALTLWRDVAQLLILSHNAAKVGRLATLLQVTYGNRVMTATAAQRGLLSYNGRPDMTLPRCYFCGQIAGRPDCDLIAQMLPGEKYVRRVLCESESFAVIPSLGPLAEGHVLLCTREHLRSFAGLDPDCHSEYQAIKVRLRHELEAVYGKATLVFEHGMAIEGDRVPCTVDHAHMHFLPLGQTLSSGFIPSIDWRVFDGSFTEANRITAGREYLLVETADGISRIAPSGAAGFESQFLRKAITAYAGLARKWNWREAPDPRAAHLAWERFTMQTEE